MKHLFSFAVALLISVPSFAWEQKPPLPIDQCAVHAPYGIPTANKADAIVICRSGYVTMHDNQAKIPVWASYAIDAQTALGCIPRTNAFVADNSLPLGKKASPTDYAGTGYDQGHLVPDGDQSYNQQVEWESFLMTNMSPQLPNLNRGVWKQLESNVRAWAVQRNHKLIVIPGDIYDTATAKKIGKSNVVVPTALFKIVIDTQTNEALAFIYEHKESQPTDIALGQVSIAEVEKRTGITFPVPKGVDKNVKPKIWTADLGALGKSKKAKCGKDD
jgi:endonuclease G